ncbi:hypothetical protein AMECASPLE_016380 [Ameca splendens]|uniref:Uncharacterized protein n=1 Tax=Ameca splendens TaxID=208324 RepID=A0ABV0ZNU1_9TELE
MKESNPESPASVSTRECVMAGLRRSSKYSFHCPIMSPVEANYGGFKHSNCQSDVFKRYVSENIPFRLHTGLSLLPKLAKAKTV